MIKPFIEYKNVSVDQYAWGDTSGIFIAQWCLLGIHHFRSSGGSWLFGLVVCNVAFGLWRDMGD